MRTSLRGLGAFLLACCLSSLAQGNTGVQWQSDLETAKRLAASSNRLVLIHFSAAWCNPCNLMDAQVFNQDSVARALEANYVPVKLDVDQQPALARQYGVRSIPWDVIISADGQVVRDFQSPPGDQAYIGAMTEIAARYRPQPTPLVAGAQSPTATPVGYGAPSASNPASSSPMNVAAGPQPAAPSQTAPAANRWSDNRYADYAQQRQQPVADPVSPPIANQVIGNPGAAIGNIPPSHPYGTSPSPQFGASPVYQAPALGAPVNNAGNSYSPQQAQNAAGAMMPNPALQPGASMAPTYNTPGYGSAPLEHSAPQYGNPQYGNPPPQYGAPSPSPISAYALEGYCPVHLMESGNWTKGDTKWGAFHRGKTYLFLSEQCQQRFLGNPDRYAPAFDGNDPVHLIDRSQTVPGRREVGCYFGVEPNRRIVLFADETSYQTFSRNPQRYAAQIFASQR